MIYARTRTRTCTCSSLLAKIQSAKNGILIKLYIHFVHCTCAYYKAMV